MTECYSFQPSIDNSSEVLILGSMPGIRSLSEQQYYAHPQNRFWRVMAELCSVPDLYSMNYDRKLEVLLEKRIALWDVIAFCERDGSLDSSILNEKPNDISALLCEYRSVKKICFNGAKAYGSFRKYFPEILSVYCCFSLPSTSPTNARYSLDLLINEWKIIL